MILDCCLLELLINILLDGGSMLEASEDELSSLLIGILYWD